MGALIGVSGGSGDAGTVVLAGVVVVTVEALSMAAGSFLSTKSQRQYLERILRDERQAIESDPAGEEREIWEMYRSRGYADAEIKTIARRLLADKDLLLEDMAHKEHGICPRSLENPMANAGVMGISYALGGGVVLLPYLVLPLSWAVPASSATAAAALLALGWVKGHLVNDGVWRSALEMLLVAFAAAAAGYAAGVLAGRGLP